MHIAIINPPHGVATGRKPNIDNRPYHFPPGILSLAAACEEAGNQVEIIDFPMNNWSLIDFENWLAATQPQAIAISFCSPSISFVSFIAKAIRKISPKTKIILGGPHITFAPEEFLKNKLADFIIRHEGEKSLHNLLVEIERKTYPVKTEGVSYNYKNKIIHNTISHFIDNLDTLPFPAYHLLDMKKYKKLLNRVSIASMRGCPFGCKFCTISELMGKKARVRSPEKLFTELNLLAEKYDIHRISFADPNFALFPKRLENLLALFQKNDFKVAFGAQTRLFTLTDKVLHLLKALGCKVIFVGIESGSDKILSHYNKNIESTQNIETLKVIEKIKNMGFEIIPSFIIGSPEETIDSINDTLNLARKIINDFDIINQTDSKGGNFQINMFGPFPGVLEDFIPLELPLEFAPALPVCSTKHVSRDILKTIWHDLYQELHPEFYQTYCLIEEAAEQGYNLYLQDFIKNSSFENDYVRTKFKTNKY